MERNRISPVLKRLKEPKRDAYHEIQISLTYTNSI